MNNHNNNCDSNLLHIECNRLVKRRSRQKICQEVLNYLELNNETKDNELNNIHNEDVNDLHPFIKFILCFCTKIEK